MHLNPFATVAHERYVEGLVAVGLGMGNPVAQTVGLGLVYAAKGYVNVEALAHFLFGRTRLEYYPYGEYVVYLLKGDVLVLHLLPDGVWRFDAREYVVFQPAFVEFPAYGGGELVEYLLALGLRLGELGLYVLIFLRVLVMETEVFKLHFYFVESETVGERGVYI